MCALGPTYPRGAWVGARSYVTDRASTCAGVGSEGELGDNSTTAVSLVPVDLVPPLGVTACARISAGGYHSLARWT